MKKLTIEEKVATKISSLLSDMRLNLKMIGSYIALQQPMQIQERMTEITEYMEQQLDHLDQHYAHGVESDNDWETENDDDRI
jgi:hypothetical protein